MKRGVIISIIVLVIIIMIGIFYMLINSDSFLSECEKLAKDFDRFAERDCAEIYLENEEGYQEKDLIVGAKLVSISESQEYAENEFIYSLNFKGQNKEETFQFISDKNLSLNDLPYHAGEFYMFDLHDICALTFSSGPHGGMVMDNNFNVLTKSDCD